MEAWRRVEYFKTTSRKTTHQGSSEVKKKTTKQQENTEPPLCHWCFLFCWLPLYLHQVTQSKIGLPDKINRVLQGREKKTRFTKRENAINFVSNSMLLSKFGGRDFGFLQKVEGKLFVFLPSVLSVFLLLGAGAKFWFSFLICKLE